MTGEIGHQQYRAPEMRHSPATVYLYNRKVDSYAMGFMLAELLTSRSEVRDYHDDPGREK